jgi:hypothetical protein
LPKVITSVLLLLFHWQIAHGQTSVEVLACLGREYTPSIAYQNCSGQFSPSFSPSIVGIYRPVSALGIELMLSSLSPTTYLYDPADQRVQVYTNSKINIQRFLTGLNYFPPLKKIHPYIGLLVGFTRAVTTQVDLTNTNTSFTWSGQVGVEYYFSSFIGVRLNMAVINTPNISDNSAYFDVDSNGDGFPSFAVGNPSTANITQWDISLGIIIRFMKSRKPY